MLVYALIGLAIVTSTLALHSINHVRLKCCRFSKSIGRYKCRSCHLEGIDDEPIQFYPTSFACYTLFILVLILIVITTDALKFFFVHGGDNDKEHISDHFYAFSEVSYHLHSDIHEDQLQITNITAAATLSIILDYVCICGIIVLAIWESLFTFYRYYTTLNSATKFIVISTKTVLRLFVIYAAIFCVLYLAQILFFYWLWPLLIAMHVAFNAFCGYKFAAILVDSYRRFEEMGDCDVRTAEANRELFHSVYVMRRVSFICIAIQSFYLCLFVVTYNMHTTYYLPIFWAVSNFIFALNFVRNRQRIFECFRVCHPISKRPTPSPSISKETAVVGQGNINVRPSTKTGDNNDEPSEVLSNTKKVKSSTVRLTKYQSESSARHMLEKQQTKNKNLNLKPSSRSDPVLHHQLMSMSPYTLNAQQHSNSITKRVHDFIAECKETMFTNTNDDNQEATPCAPYPNDIEAGTDQKQFQSAVESSRSCASAADAAERECKHQLNDTLNGEIHFVEAYLNLHAFADLGFCSSKHLHWPKRNGDDERAHTVRMAVIDVMRKNGRGISDASYSRLKRVYGFMTDTASMAEALTEEYESRTSWKMSGPLNEKPAENAMETPNKKRVQWMD